MAQECKLASSRKRLGVHPRFMHCRLVGSDLAVCVIAVPALTMGTLEAARVSWGRIDVGLAEKTGRLDERERELAEHQGDAEGEMWWMTRLESA